MPKVQVVPLGAAYDCRDDETLLAGALREGRYLRYGCRHGGCGSCRILLVEGDVEQSGSSFALPASDRADGWVLACASVPVEDCVVDVSATDLTEEEFLAGDQVRGYTAEIAGIRRLTPDVRGVRLRLLDPPSMRFTAGQFVNVEVPGTSVRRAYSMANPPSDSGYADLVVRLLPGGAFSALLDGRLVPGDQLRLYGPFGQLKVRLSHRPMIMVAGGSGLAPILSMVGDLADRRNTRQVTVFFGARSATDLYHLDRLRALQDRMPCLEIVSVLSEHAPADQAGETGLVTDVIGRRFPRLEGYDAYLCGPPSMIDAAAALLTARGLRPRNIYFDAFVPTG
ncbi:MAG TPA: 2Fe-2S iron-sulfur cluster binding domain-containing protein [Streptosporangiaceae bacterium]|nr:2Fe-2S iron-sulfur cluster binding domain-containing protein [Streptosporangiaceae bacterium]